MTSVTATTGVAQTDTATKTPAAAATTTGIGADFSMFLKLLTTQMQNQDPLDPMDSSEYTQQLVQYSQVEQSIQQNGTLKDILASLSKQDMAQASGFIGRAGEFDSAVSGLGDKPASWTYSAPRAMTSGTLSITDAAGKIVDSRTVALTGTSGSYSWDGMLADGTKAAAGAYTLSVEAQDAAGATVPVTIHSVGTVGGVNTKNGLISLGVNGVPMSIDQLISLNAVE